MGLARRGITGDLQAHVLSEIGIDDVTVAYQPIVDLQTGKIFAYEALLRSKDPRFAGPPHVIAEAIKKLVCGELGRMIRTEAVQACPDHNLFLNVHPAEFDEGWMVRPDDPIFQHEHQVFLEITESVPMSHAAHCLGILKEVRGKGVRIAVDDLGAGYSNLRSIADLAPDIVKLDRSLIVSLDQDASLFRLTRAVIQLCTEMDARVVVEGIETAGELQAAKDAGAHYAQGYYLARPAFPRPEVIMGFTPDDV